MSVEITSRERKLMENCRLSEVDHYERIRSVAEEMVSFDVKDVFD